jgi:hypothetical protein
MDVIERFRPDDPPTIDPNFFPRKAIRKKTASGGPSVQKEKLHIRPPCQIVQSRKRKIGEKVALTNKDGRAVV